MDGPPTRRDFLRLAAGAAAGAVIGGAAGCSGSGPSKASKAAQAAKAAKGGGAATGRTLRIAQWGHYVPEFDTWFDGDYTKRWGDEHGVAVILDHIPFAQKPPPAAAEGAARGPHAPYR